MNIIIGKRSDLPFSRKSDRKKEKSTVSFTHEQNIICSQTQLDGIAHEHTIICRQLFAGHAVDSRPMKRKKNLLRMIIGVTVPADCRVNSKESGKIEKYQDLKREISTMWAMRKVEVMPVVVGALGAIGVEDGITRNCKNTAKRE